jgi:hypothetical protein
MTDLLGVHKDLVILLGLNEAVDNLGGNVGAEVDAQSHGGIDLKCAQSEKIENQGEVVFMCIVFMCIVFMCIVRTCVLENWRRWIQSASTFPHLLAFTYEYVYIMAVSEVCLHQEKGAWDESAVDHACW